jgi:hypothetical protein
LDDADQEKYGGQIQEGEGHAIASTPYKIWVLGVGDISSKTFDLVLMV